MKKIAIGLLVIGLLGAGYHWKDSAVGWIGHYLEQGQDDPIPVTRLQKKDYRILVPAQGELTGLETTSVAAPRVRGGSLKIAWLAAEGSIVQEGEVLLRFDNTDALLSLETNQNQLKTFDRQIDRTGVKSQSEGEILGLDRQQAEVEVDYAEHQVRHDDSIFSIQQIQESVVSAALAHFKKDAIDYKGEIQEKVTDADRQILEIEKGKALTQVQTAQEMLSSMEVVSPVAGVVIYKRHGWNPIQVGSEVWPGQPILEVAALFKFQGQLFVVETEINGVEAGKEVELALDAFPGESFRGTIAQVGKAPQQQSRRDPRKYFSCDVSLDVPLEIMRRLKAGMSFKGQILLAERQGAFILPKSAVFKDEDNFRVYVKNGEEFKEQPVEILDSDHGFYVVDGVEPGDLVALRHPFKEQSLVLPDFNAPSRTSARRFIIFN